MDQVTTFMEENLASTKRHEDDKILTKTMINNYAKNKLLPPPEKKRYSREHLLMLIFIYYFKNILSISDIQTLLGPMLISRRPPQQKYTSFEEYMDAHGGATAPIEAHFRRLRFLLLQQSSIRIRWQSAMWSDLIFLI